MSTPMIELHGEDGEAFWLNPQSVMCLRRRPPVLGGSVVHFSPVDFVVVTEDIDTVLRLMDRDRR